MSWGMTTSEWSIQPGNKEPLARQDNDFMLCSLRIGRSAILKKQVCVAYSGNKPFYFVDSLGGSRG